MGSKRSASYALFLSLNLLLFTLVAPCNTCACITCSNPNPNPIPKPNPNPNTPTTPSGGMKCPRDALIPLKLGVCANLLGGLVGAVVGNPPNTPCYTLLQGLADLEAAVCLCTVIKANVLGINLSIPLSLSLLVNTCGRKLPSGFQCA